MEQARGAVGVGAVTAEEWLGWDDNLSTEDMRRVEEQLRAELTGLAEEPAGDLIEERELVDQDFLDAAAEIERFAASYTGGLDALLDDVVQDDAELAVHAARRARSVERARAWSMVSDELVLPDPRMTPAKRAEWAIHTFESELGARLHISQPSASHLIDQSRTLVQELPSTLDALGSARISLRHAQVIIEQASTLPLAARGGFEEVVLTAAVRLSVRQFEKMAIRTREALHPESITARTRKAAADRQVVFEADRDGMGWLHHYLPIADAKAAYDRITALARSLQGDGETRTLTQRRSDVATQLLLDGAVINPADLAAARARKAGGGGTTVKQPQWGIRPTVFVTVPVTTLLGGEEPGHLDGYGPIDPDTARRLAAKAPSFIRLLTHPETGIVLSMGRKRYKVPKDLLLWVKMRDETCRKPFCNQPAAVTDLDHTAAWSSGGPTADSNLACLCVGCHQMKHRTTWQVKQLGGGVLEWTSPLGRTHITQPAIDLHSTSLPSTSLPSTSLPTARPPDEAGRDETPRDEAPPHEPPPDEPPPF
jgi:Domain of unknown function (DUF222)/HNH endonuclease